MLELLVSDPVALLALEDVSEPETDPDAEPETDPEALAFVESEEVALEVAGAGVADVDCVAEEVDDVASVDDVSLIVLLLCVSREQPGPKANAAPIKAVAPNIVRFFFM